MTRELRKRSGLDVTPRTIPPTPVPAVAYFLQLGPYSFCHLSIKPPYEDSIKILIY